jgi:hypothetical protein
MSLYKRDVILYVFLPRINRKTIADSAPNRALTAKSERNPILTTPQLVPGKAHHTITAKVGAIPIDPPKMAYDEYLLMFLFRNKKYAGVPSTASQM